MNDRGHRMQEIRVMGFTPSKVFILLMVVFITVLLLYHWKRFNAGATDNTLNVTRQNAIGHTTHKQSKPFGLITSPLNQLDKKNISIYNELTERTPTPRHLSTQRPFFQGVTELSRGTQEGETDPKLTPILHQNVQEEICSTEFKGSHIIAMEKPLGRTGNLIFQLMVLFSVAKRMCYTPVLHPEYKERLKNVINMTGFQFMDISTIENKLICHELDNGTIAPDILSLDNRFNWTLNGYFQNWKYFDSYESYLRDIIKFRKHNVFMAQILLKVLYDYVENVKIIAIHVRRGDFLVNEDCGFKTADREYIERAINLMKEQYKNNILKFVFVSDDIAWCKDNFQSDESFYFSQFHSVGIDLALISLCDHVIITSGSFGWIGAWLSGKDVIYYKGYPKPNTWLGKRLKPKDYYPPNWIGIY